MALGRVVPWGDWEEWEGVRTGIFSDDQRLRRAALDRVHAWEARGRVPLGAEITACLLELRMRDQEFGGTADAARQPASESESLLRLQYAMLVIRLVNGISDSSQKGRVAMSVASLAEDAGIPRILVDVRHDASHNELPSLALLRLASAAALSWLSSAYWQRQADHLHTCRAHISSLLQRYTELQRAAILKQAITGKPEEDDSAVVDHASDAQADTAAYSGPVGQRQRREVTAEMWEQVHAAGHLLVGPLLDHSLLETQEQASSTPAEGGSSKLTPEQVAAAVWEAVVQGLSGSWPQLRQLLLAAAVQRLCRPDPTSASRRDDQIDEVSAAAVSEPDVLAQRVAWLLGVLRESGHKRGRQQKVGAKRKSQADGDVGGQRQQWKPSAAQLNSLLACCLRALAPNADRQAGSSAQDRAAALSRVALMLLERRTSAKEEGPSEGSLVQPQQLQRLMEISAGDAAAADAASGHSAGMQELSEALLAAVAAQEELIQRSNARASASEGKAAKKPRWFLAEDWAPCALGMLPSPHHPCGRMPTLNTSQAQSTELPAVEASSCATAEKSENHAAVLPELGILEDVRDTSIAEGGHGKTPPNEMEVQDYFSRFEAQKSGEPRQVAAEAEPPLAVGQIQSIAAAIKVL